jgi:hypothetical protein
MLLLCLFLINRSIERKTLTLNEGTVLAFGIRQKKEKEFVMTHHVTDEQFGHFSRRRRDLERRVLEGTVPFDQAMRAMQALGEGDQQHFVSLVGPTYPKGTIALWLEIDISLPLEEMIRRGKYANEEYALREITEDRFPINRDVPELQYSTSVLLVPGYRKGITFKGQDAEMETNRLQQHGVVETLAIGEQYPHLQFAYYIVGCGSSWRPPGDYLHSPALWQIDGKRKLDLDWRFPENQLNEDVRCVAAPQAVA